MKKLVSMRVVIDEDIIGGYDDFTCLSWKEILSHTNTHYKVNYFLVINIVCIYENVILPKPTNLCMIRFVDNTNAMEGDHQDMEACELDHGENMKTHG